jgi:hypothetical protein
MLGRHLICRQRDAAAVLKCDSALLHLRCSGEPVMAADGVVRGCRSAKTTRSTPTSRNRTIDREPTRSDPQWRSHVVWHGHPGGLLLDLPIVVFLHPSRSRRRGFRLARGAGSAQCSSRVSSKTRLVVCLRPFNAAWSATRRKSGLIGVSTRPVLVEAIPKAL